ncbi:hypothetical protein QJS04_geneDACA006031 [Acorus gramineus]|uniref:Uncharacterized protein n=1 Tax=Acorus gramineus TaxID=55184 RepID=A0AAV9B5X8_ACOGR|nr:hypothetical protein QJS04_geneDACA006031 [Acorus gramineus]
MTADKLNLRDISGRVGLGAPKSGRWSRSRLGQRRRSRSRLVWLSRSLATPAQFLPRE